MSRRFVALTTPPMSMTLVSGRADVARATRAGAVVLRSRDLLPCDVRTLGIALILRSVHSVPEAEEAIRDGADGVIVGAIWPTATHPERAPLGTALLAQVVSLGVPAFAIGGVTEARMSEVVATGAWGVAAITALWHSPDPYRAATRMVAAWN